MEAQWRRSREIHQFIDTYYRALNRPSLLNVEPCGICGQSGHLCWKKNPDGI